MSLTGSETFCGKGENTYEKFLEKKEKNTLAETPRNESL